MRILVLVILLCFGSASGSGRQVSEVCAANLRSDSVTCFDATSGERTTLAVAAGAGGLKGATGIDFGPDGHLYVASSGTHQVLRFDGRTGALIDVFVADSALASPFTVLFGPDGHLYVSSGTRNIVLRYDGRTGRRLNVAARHEMLKTPIGLAFAGDGRLLVANAGSNDVSRFDPATGERVDVFATDSLRFPSDIAIDDAGDVFVSSAFTGAIVRFDGSTGAFRGVVGRLPDGGVPVGIRFLPDGTLLAADFAKSRLYRFPRGGAPPALLAAEGLAGPENIVVRARR